MVATDPVDARLLGMLAEMGRAAVHDLAARAGMDPREVASRLVALSGSGVPLLVGVECDQNGVRQLLAANSGGWNQGYSQQQGPPSGGYQMQQGNAYPGMQQQVQNQPYPGMGQQGMQQGGYQTGPPSGAHQVQSPPQGYQHRGGPPSNPFPVVTGPASTPFPAQAQPAETFSTWGPPQSSSWARGDGPPGAPANDNTQTVRTTRGGSRTGVVGAKLETEGLEGERLSIQVVEVVDPADYLFTAAGYRLQPGERSVVVHTELHNRGSVSFSSLPDLYLMLVTADEKTIAKAPVSLSSRPPHRIGVAPGETAGGHTVYVLPEETDVRSVRWSPRPDDEQRSLTWTVEN